MNWKRLRSKINAAGPVRRIPLHPLIPGRRCGLAVAFLLLMFANPGCGPGFQAKQRNYDDSLKAALTRLNWRESKTSAVPNLPNFWSDTPFDGHLLPSETLIEFDMQINYGRAFQELSREIAKALPNICQGGDNVVEANTSRYKAGELPCGRILNSNWKYLTTINIPEERSSSGGFDIKVRQIELPIHISRKAYQGAYSESSLASLSVERLMSSPQLGQDISLRYRPAGDKMNLDICLNLPGLDIAMPKQRVTVDLKKYILFTDLKFSANFDVHPGTAGFDYIRTCFSTRVRVDHKTLEPHAELVEIEPAKFSNTRWTGLKIDIKDWWLQLIDGIARLFQFNFRKKIAESAMNEFKDITESEYESGQWILKLNKGMFQNKLVKKLNSQVGHNFDSNGTSASTISLKERMKARCRAVRLITSRDELRLAFLDLCERFVDDIDLRISPFHYSKELADKGCYGHFARINGVFDKGGQEKWWSKECKFIIRVQARIPDWYLQHREEIQQLLASFDSGINLSEEARRFLNRYGITENMLGELVAKLKRRGFREPTLEDLKREFPRL